MVFPSVPVFLDPPNWNQHQSQLATGGVVGAGGDGAHQLPPAPPLRPEGSMPGAGARPASMADRARLGKVPQPETGLNCPRCDSTNTKFCYFNNYSLSQPRHFCKTCRRYWTRGGALRNVPVGGGCRRNKRSKGSGSSKASAADRQAGPSASSAPPAVHIGAIPSNVPPHLQPPFMAPFHPLADHFGAAANIGLGFPSIHPIDGVDFQAGGSSVAGLEQWRLQQVQQFPLTAGLDPPPPSVGLFPFDGEGTIDGGVGGFSGPVHGKPSATGFITQLATVKIEGRPQGLNLPRQYLGITGSTDQYWVGSGSASGGSTVDASSGGGGWTDLPGFNSASTSNIL